ncbi:6-bladed beta-propeller [Longimicrobium sp.]|uniref:6-bladed beta-propeller n=1 Tax=Longimicrobium sp. TaxID=2029185 RepID=UPI002ED86D44
MRVKNPEQGLWAGASAWRAVEDLRLGAADGGGADVFAFPAALEADAAGRLYVLDAQAAQVRVFGPDGTHVRSLGRQGQGPGELSQPIGFALAPDGAVWVVDPANRRYTVWDSTGALRESVPRQNDFAMVPWPGRFDRRGRLWDVGPGSGRAGAGPTLLRRDGVAAAGAVIPLPSVSPEQFTTHNGPVASTAPVPFSPRLEWALDPDGRVWSGVTGSYRLAQWQPGGDTLRVVEREAAPVPVSDAERDSVPAQLKWFTDQGGKVDLSRVPRNKPAFASMSTDDRGWVWVRPSVPAGTSGTPLDVFDPEGRYHGRVALPILVMEGMPLVVRGDRIYAVTLSDAGVPQVVRYRLQGRTAGAAERKVAAR